MSLTGFFDHCQAASEALVECVGIYRQGGSVLSDYADQNQAEADAARQYLEKAATELKAACELSESVVQEVSDEDATAILAVTAAAKKGNFREFFHCWQKHKEHLLSAAFSERVKLGPKCVKNVDLRPEFVREFADEALSRVLHMFNYEGRPLDHFWKVVEVAENAGVYEVTSGEKIRNVVADARRQIEQRIPWPPERGKKSVPYNDRMYQAIEDDARRKGWDSNEWAEYLGTDPGYVRRLSMWKALKEQGKRR